MRIWFGCRDVVVCYKQSCYCNMIWVRYTRFYTVVLEIMLPKHNNWSSPYYEGEHLCLMLFFLLYTELDFWSDIAENCVYIGWKAVKWHTQDILNYCLCECLAFSDVQILMEYFVSCFLVATSFIIVISRCSMPTTDTYSSVLVQLILHLTWRILPIFLYVLIRFLSFVLSPCLFNYL